MCADIYIHSHTHSLSDLEVQVVGLIKVIVDPEAIMTESTAVRIVVCSSTIVCVCV